RVYRIPYPGRGTAIVKERFRKAYRQPDLDRKLTSRRVIQEARSLQRCKRAGLDTPTLYLLDVEGAMIYMEDIAGKSVRDTLGFSGDYGSHGVLSEQIGKNIALMHNLDVIHGDLTTSNMMVRSTSNNLVIIDFGLSFVSTLQEDKAVDLYVLERALSSTHPGSEKLVGPRNFVTFGARY
ncbi:kinase-like domain-containing protein, partial [Cladochytrium replicatum]